MADRVAGVLGWRRTLVYCADPRLQDELILGLLRDVVDASASPVTFTRHWRRGAHLRVDWKPGAGADDGHGIAIEERLREWVRLHPSKDPQDESQYLEQATLLARLEHYDGQLLPRAPNNTVMPGRWLTRARSLGSEEAAEAWQHFDVACNAVVFALVEQRRSDPHATMIAALMFATAQEFFPPLESGYLSFRSHVEAFLANTRDGECVRAGWRSRYRGVQSRLRGELDRVRSESHSVPVQAWLAAAAELTRVSIGLVSSGKLAMPVFDPRRAGMDGSSFHTELSQDEAAVESLALSQQFTAYRVALNGLYRVFARAGLAPLERFEWCYLASRTVEDHFQIQPPQWTR